MTTKISKSTHVAYTVFLLDDSAAEQLAFHIGSLSSYLTINVSASAVAYKEASRLFGQVRFVGFLFVCLFSTVMPPFQYIKSSYSGTTVTRRPNCLRSFF